jgi:hypothetical protein
MNKPTTYVDGVHPKSTRRKLSTARRLAERLLNTLEECEFKALQGQSMEALKSLLRVLSEAIRMYEQQEPNGRNSHKLLKKA